jgi:phospholipase A2
VKKNARRHGVVSSAPQPPRSQTFTQHSSSYNAHHGETDDQVVYEKAILASHHGHHVHLHGHGHGQSEDDASSERAIGAKASSSVKGLLSYIKPTVQTVKSFVTLDGKIHRDMSDPILFPEVAQQARVRRDPGLCAEEQAFVVARRLHVRDHFARYMGLDPAAVHPDDVPTVAFGGSGGGYRAMLAVLGYSLAMKKAGMWDLLTYISGVSGSCE